MGRLVRCGCGRGRGPRGRGLGRGGRAVESRRSVAATAVCACLALLVALFAPGCNPWSVDGLGSLCAAPAEGGEHCVPANQDPAAAWDQAAKAGSQPVQMWATWRRDATIDQVVSDTDAIRAWLRDIDRVTSHVRDTRGSAESYRASMGGQLGALLRRAVERQGAILVEMGGDPTGRFKKALMDKAAAEKSPVLAEMAADKQTMAAAQAVFDKAAQDAAPLAAAYATIAAQFTAYRATEAAETAAYVAFSQQASGASLATLPGIEQAIVTAALGAGSKPNDLRMAAMKLIAEIQVFDAAADSALAPHEDFLEAHGVALPDMTSSAMRSLNAMLGYVQQRVARSDAAASALLAGIAMRKKALALVGAPPPPPAMAKIESAGILAATLAFQTDATASADALSSPPPVSPKLKLAYLAARYDHAVRLLQLAPLCRASSSSWREAACDALRERIGAAGEEIKTTLPRKIAAGIAAIRARGGDARTLDAAQARLDAGDVKAAALAHDAALRAMEEGT